MTRASANHASGPRTLSQCSRGEGRRPNRRPVPAARLDRRLVTDGHDQQSYAQRGSPPPTDRRKGKHLQHSGCNRRQNADHLSGRPSRHTRRTVGSARSSCRGGSPGVADRGSVDQFVIRSSGVSTTRSFTSHCRKWPSSRPRGRRGPDGRAGATRHGSGLKRPPGR